MFEDDQNEIPLLEDSPHNVSLFWPHLPESAKDEVLGTLNSRWIGQGPKVELFEKEFASKFCGVNPGIAVGSGTDALHLAYILAGIKPGDEVLTPVFTCTATNIPLLYMGAQPVFVDVEENTLNINVGDIEHRISEKSKAIVCVHYGGLVCDMDEIHRIASKHNLVVIEDAAHAVGAKYKGKSVGSMSDFTMFSFQAIKHITTGDGGYLSMKNSNLFEQAKRMRWFGIDRSKKQLGIWENDIKEVGYKYQMTDLGAAIGLASLKDFDNTLAYRRRLFHEYCSKLIENRSISILSKETPDKFHAAWLFTIRCSQRRKLQAHLARNGIESNQVHYRNDRYSIFGSRRVDLPSMDRIEEEYLVLPLHTRMSLADVERICHHINEFSSLA